MKKIISLLLSLVMLFTLGSVCASASDDDVTVDFDDVAGNSGFTIVYFNNTWVNKGENTVNLYIKNNPGVTDLSITFNLPEGFTVTAVQNGDMGEAVLNNGVITVSSSEEYTDNSCVAKVTFNVTASGFNTVGIGCAATNGQQEKYVANASCILKVREVKGDVDGDGDRDATDLANLKLHLAGAKAIGDEGIVNPDVNGDGEVIATDLAQLKLMLAGVEFDSSLKVLGIGNSFTVDATTYLYDVAVNAGEEDVIIARSTIGGCSLDKHWTQISENNAEYSYAKYADGTSKAMNNTTLSYALGDEDWDVIVIQQVSGDSGDPDTYGNLQNIIDYIKSVCPEAKIMWQMTWAYENNVSPSKWDKYDRDQMTMYNAIVDTVESKILTNSDIVKVIPSGTAIQNLRGYCDVLTRDGYHMSYTLGRHAVAMTWYAAITGKSIDHIDYINSKYPVTENDLLAIKDAVNKAIANPYEVTQSAYAE